MVQVHVKRFQTVKLWTFFRGHGQCVWPLVVDTRCVLSKVCSHSQWAHNYAILYMYWALRSRWIWMTISNCTMYLSISICLWDSVCAFLRAASEEHCKSNSSFSNSLIYKQNIMFARHIKQNYTHVTYNTRFYYIYVLWWELLFNKVIVNCSSTIVLLCTVIIVMCEFPLHLYVIA